MPPDISMLPLDATDMHGCYQHHLLQLGVLSRIRHMCTVYTIPHTWNSSDMGSPVVSCGTNRFSTRPACTTLHKVYDYHLMVNRSWHMMCLASGLPGSVMADCSCHKHPALPYTSSICSTKHRAPWFRLPVDNIQDVIH